MFSRDARLGPFQRLAGVLEERLDTPVRAFMGPGVISIAKDVVASRRAGDDQPRRARRPRLRPEERTAAGLSHGALRARSPGARSRADPSAGSRRRAARRHHLERERRRGGAALVSSSAAHLLVARRDGVAPEGVVTDLDVLVVLAR